MANPQIELGHVDLANEIVDQFCRYRISGEEWLALWSIIRKTYGWKKKQDRISLSQFSAMTGMKRQTVLRALNKLSSKKIIGVIKNDDSGINIYSFNKNFDQWEPLSKKVTVSSKKIMTVIKKDNKVSSFLSHTKETLTKETLTKEIYNADFLSFWELYPSKVEKKYAFKCWKKLNGTRPDIKIILAAIDKQIEWRENAQDGEFRPEWKHPSTWLNKGCWDDVLEETEGSIRAWEKKKQAEMEAEKDGIT
jgi:phage replication O-like protein O